jgi:hypothetical protein
MVGITVIITRTRCFCCLSVIQSCQNRGWVDQEFLQVLNAGRGNRWELDGQVSKTLKISKEVLNLRDVLL